jgi:hypothetical protein
MTLSGGRNDTVVDNTFANNGAWGFLVVPYPDSGMPSLGQSCPGTGGVETAGFGCVYDPMNNALLHSTFIHNGFCGNPRAAELLRREHRSNGSAPPNLEQSQPTCGRLTTGPNTGGPLLGQVLCDTGTGTCPYPQPTGVVMHPLPKSLPTMPNPCSGVPDNAWCSGGEPV